MQIYCSDCKKEVTGRLIQAVGRPWHAEWCAYARLVPSAGTTLVCAQLRLRLLQPPVRDEHAGLHGAPGTRVLPALHQRSGRAGCVSRRASSPCDAAVAQAASRWNESSTMQVRAPRGAAQLIACRCVNNCWFHRRSFRHDRRSHVRGNARGDGQVHHLPAGHGGVSPASTHLSCFDGLHARS
jgi:hypothetical protein